MNTKFDLTNKRFGKLVALEVCGSTGNGRRWRCICDCGNEKIINRTNLVSSGTKSCGCAHKDYGKKLILPNNQAAKNIVYNRLEQRAKKSKKELSISKTILFDILIRPCYYCGIDFSIYTKSKYGEFKCNGLDRIDNAKGYTVNNVLPCCQYCNGVRMDILSVDEAKKTIDFIKSIRNTKESPWLEKRRRDLKL